MNRMIVRKNITYISIILFIALFFGIYYTKPDFAFNRDGTVKNFGVGYKSKTVVPLWLIVIILAIFCYLGVIYYIMNPTLV